MSSSIDVVKFTNSKPSRNKCREIVIKILQSRLKYDSPPNLVFDELGKPSIEQDPELAFSYAHSPSQLVIAIDSDVQSIGIDTEPIYRQDEIGEMAEMAFSPEELAVLKKSDYVTAWCLKEAIVKRLGTGFREAEPSEFSVKVDHKTYKLYLRNHKIHDGYFSSINDGDDIIVVCSDKPTEDFLLKHRVSTDMKVKE